MTAELKDQAGHDPVNHKRVARVMRELKLFGYAKKRKVTTTVSDQKKPVFSDLVGRKFTADKPNQLYVGDITYLPIQDGSNMYLATVIDCYSRRVVGFSIADHMRTSLVQDALLMAKGQRGSLKGAIFH
ncbi:integrase [Corynebacterium glutamicum]|nr:integrase [Corynebacterium glutamicum]